MLVLIQDGVHAALEGQRGALRMASGGCHGPAASGQAVNLPGYLRCDGEAAL